MEMNIKVTKTSDNKIDVRDSADIRLMLLTENENKGLYTYFEVRMAQAKEVKTRTEQALHKHGVTNRICVTCLYCQSNPSSEFRYDRHKCTLVKPFVNITDATKFVCDDWTEIPF